ncbi:MAG: YdcF family protein [Deltaproteobacteria bacterium]|nr:YdcF family protein [Deltaproteobacteria bacterium]
MFFVLSKTAGLLVSPMSLCSVLLAISGVLRLLRRRPRLQRWLAIGAIAQLLFFSTGLASHLLLIPLENRYAPPATLPTPPGAIVMLTGMAEPRAGSYDLSDPADRFVETLRLARRYPRARILLVGGSSQIIGDSYRESELLGRLALDLGLEKERLVLERRSRNTHENAENAVRLLLPSDRPFLLVTSASHMPRAMGCFRRAGVEPIAWPVDVRHSSLRVKSLLPNEHDLGNSEAALREYVGLVTYWLAGYLSF